MDIQKHQKGNIGELIDDDDSIQMNMINKPGALRKYANRACPSKHGLAIVWFHCDVINNSKIFQNNGKMLT